ncbi:HDOD domain-containing protein [Marinobacterium stanieri]|uniref:HDOD domain-containing protein n=1 Tax=Marinobacterium stanieri TaxID=49186 RepID=UPI003A91596F
MIGFWKRNGAQADEQKAVQQSDKGVSFGLGESAQVELINQARHLTLEVGASVAQALAAMESSGTSRLLLVQSGRVHLDISENASPLELGAGQVVSCMASGCPLLERLHVQERSVLLCLSESALSQLQDSTQTLLLRQGQAFAAQANAALFAAADKAEARYLQLSDALFRSMETGEVQFAESDAVTQVVKRIPRLPLASVELLRTLTDENSTHAQVAELVHQDPALTAQLLKAINSPAYSLGQSVTDASQAVSLLGFEGVYQIIMAESLRKSLPDNEQFRNSYQRALMLSHIAFALAQATGKGRPAEVSTIALLHDLGRVVIALLVRQNPSFKGVIRQVHPGVVGARLLKDWQLPEAVWRAIEVQHYPEFAMPARLPQDQLIPAALMYISGWVLDGMQKRETTALFMPEYQRVLGMKPVDVDTCWEQILKPRLKQRRNALPVVLKNWLEQSD